MKPVIIIAREMYAETLCTAVESTGLRSEQCDHLSRVLDGIHQRKYSLALIEIDHSNSRDCAAARAVSPYAPVIVMTPGCGGDLCVSALECGADDCVPQSVSVRELGARIRNVLRRSGTMGAEARPVILQTLAEMRARVDGRVVNLTAGEVEVLALLTDEAPTPVTALEIAERLGARRGTVEARVKSLRTKLGRDRLVSRGRLGYVYAAESARSE